MTLGDFVRMVRTNLRLIFIFASLGLLFGFFQAARQPVQYTATSLGYVVSSAGELDAGSNSLAMGKLPIYASVVGTAPVAEGVIKILKLNTTPADIASRFAVSASDAAPMMTISAVAGTPQEAKALADAVIQATSDEVRRLDTYSRGQGAANVSSAVSLIPQSTAALPGSPSSPNYPVTMMLGAGVGALLGLLLGFLRKQLDTRVRSMDDLEGLTQFTTLSVIPEDKQFDRIRGDGLLDGSTSAGAAEAVRQLRTNLRFVDVDKPPRSIVISSANPGEGKSVLCANLAVALAAAGQPTIVIDADLRRPMQSTIFGADNAVGLTQVLSGDVELKDAVQSTSAPNLHLITSGRIPPNPSELVGSHKMGQLIKALVDNGYMVLIDAPPLLPVTDAGLLSGIADGTILVLAVGKTFHQQAKLAARILQQVGGRVLGAVLNRAPVKGIGAVVYGYGYGSYSRDYASAYDHYGSKKTETASTSGAAAEPKAKSGSRTSRRSARRSS